MNSSSSDYLSVKKRKLFLLNAPNKSSSEYIQNKQFKIIQTSITKEFEPFERFSIVLPNVPLAFGLKDNHEMENHEMEKEKEETENKKMEDASYIFYNPVYYYPEIYPSETNETEYENMFSNKNILFIKKVTVDFIDGKYEILSKTLTVDKVMSITKAITKLSKTKNEVSQQITKTYLENLNIIVDYLNLNKTFKNTTRQLEELEQTIHLLKENDKRTNPPELFAVSVDAPLLEMKEEYVEYHRRYGIPEFLNYDLAKLNDIKQHNKKSCIVYN